MSITYIVLIAPHIVCKHGATELVSAKEAEVAGNLSGYGGGQTLEEAWKPLVSYDELHHGPHWAADTTEQTGIQTYDEKMWGENLGFCF